MKRSKLFTFLLIGGCVFSLSSYMGYKAFHNPEDESDLLLNNIEALASGGESTPSNTGPGKTYDCPGVGTGDGKMCMSENEHPCTQIPC